MTIVPRYVMGRGYVAPSDRLNIAACRSRRPRLHQSGESRNGNVILFLVYGTSFEEHDFKEFLVLQFGDDDMVESQLIAAIARYEEGN